MASRRCCCGVPCDGCTTTPTTWTVSFTGVATSYPCQTCLTGHWTKGTGTATLGTYTLAKGNSHFLGNTTCEWIWTGTGPSYTESSFSACTPVNNTYDGLTVALLKSHDHPHTTGTISVAAYAQPDWVQTGAGWFGGQTNTATEFDCCSAVTINNASSAYGAGCSSVLGINGSCVATPHC